MIRLLLLAGARNFKVEDNPAGEEDMTRQAKDTMAGLLQLQRNVRAGNN